MEKDLKIESDCVINVNINHAAKGVPIGHPKHHNITYKRFS